MSPDYTKTLLEVLKLAPRYLVSLGIIAAFLLFTPGQWLKSLGIYDFAQHQRSWLALVFIVTGVLFVVDRAIAIFDWMHNRMMVAKIRKGIIKHLESLTEDEKQILRFYFTMQTKTNYLRFEDGVVQGLESKLIIFRASELGNMIEGFAYNISDFVWDYLHKNSHLLSGTTNFYRTDKRPGIFGI